MNKQKKELWQYSTAADRVLIVSFFRVQELFAYPADLFFSVDELSNNSQDGEYRPCRTSSKKLLRKLVLISDYTLDRLIHESIECALI